MKGNAGSLVGIAIPGGDQAELCSHDRFAHGVEEPAAIGAEVGRVERIEPEFLGQGLVGKGDHDALGHTTLVILGRDHHLERHANDQVPDLESALVRLEDLTRVDQVRPEADRGIARLSTVART